MQYGLIFGFHSDLIPEFLLFSKIDVPVVLLVPYNKNFLEEYFSSMLFKNFKDLYFKKIDSLIYLKL